MPSFAPSGDVETSNSVVIETPTGYKTFKLVFGDITTVSTDLLVVSTHSNLDFEASGLVLDRLWDQHDVVVDRAQRWLTLGEDLWTCFQEQHAPTPFSGLLTICLPQILHQPDPLPFFDRAMRGVFASCASLEYMGCSYPVVSLPVLYGQRLVAKHYPEAVKSLIRHALDWLKQSKGTKVVQFVIFEAQKKEAWNEAMDQCLGRFPISAAADQVLQSLCLDLAQQLTSHTFPELQEPLAELAGDLSHPDKISIESICNSGRKLVEAMLDVVLRQQATGKIKSANFNSIATDIDDLRNRGRIAPWIASYMHSLRIFGNHTAHYQNDALTYRPNRLSRGDIVSALCAIRALLSSWPEIHQGHIITNDTTGY